MAMCSKKTHSACAGSGVMHTRARRLDAWNLPEGSVVAIVTCIAAQFFHSMTAPKAGTFHALEKHVILLFRW